MIKNPSRLSNISSISGIQSSMKNLSRSTSRENISRNISKSVLQNNSSKKSLNNSVSQITNHKNTIMDNKSLSSMSAVELTSTINRLKSRVARQILNIDHLEKEMNTKLNFLHSTQAFKLDGDMNISNDTDAQVVSDQTVNRLKQRVEQLKQLGNTKLDEWIFIPSFESLKLMVMSNIKLTTRDIKRDIIQNQLKFEELYNYLFLQRNINLDSEIDSLNFLSSQLEVQHSNITCKREQQRIHLESIDALNNSKNVNIEISELQERINALEHEVSTERSGVSKLNVVYEKKKRVNDDLDNQLEYLKKSVHERELEIAHGVERKLPIDIEKDYDHAHQLIKIKINKINDLNCTIHDLNQKYESIDNTANFHIEEEKLRNEFNSNQQTYKEKIRKEEKNLSIISGDIINLNQDYQNKIESLNVELKNLKDQMLIKGSNQSVSTDDFEESIINDINNFKNIERFKNDRIKTIRNVQELKNIPSDLQSIMDGYYEQYKDVDQDILYKSVKEYKLKKEEKEQIKNGLQMYILLNSYNTINITQAINFKKVEYSLDEVESILKKKPFLLENEPDVRKKVGRHILKNRKCIDPIGLESGLKSICKFKNSVPIDQRQSESKLNRTVCDYFNSKVDKLRQKFNTNTTMHKLIHYIDNDIDTISLNKCCKLYIQLANFKLNYVYRDVSFVNSWNSVQLDELINQIQCALSKPASTQMFI